MKMQKPVSRQRRWQLKMRKAGRCEICGKPSAHYRTGYLAGRCEKHLAAARRYKRERYWRNHGLRRPSAWGHDTT